MVKNQPANTRDAGDMDWIPGSGRSPGGGNDNPMQYSCLENPMDRGAGGQGSGGLGGPLHGVSKSLNTMEHAQSIVPGIQQTLKNICSDLPGSPG